ncbi:MAG: FHA domain-containing protein [Rhodomicrobium sp.]|nr:FHA domain-containing protein [Rhodomicrobium sp.]
MLYNKFMLIFLDQFRDFSGRCGRADYFVFVSIITFCYVLFLNISNGEIIFSTLIYILLLVLATMRRLHDTGHRFVWALVPVYNIYLTLLPSVKTKHTTLNKNPFQPINDHEIDKIKNTGKIYKIDISSIIYPLSLIGIAKYILIIGCGYLCLKSLFIAIGAIDIAHNIDEWKKWTPEQVAISLFVSKSNWVELNRALFILSIFFALAVFVGWSNIGNFGFSGSHLIWLIITGIFIFSSYYLITLDWDLFYKIFWCGCSERERFLLYISFIIISLIVVCFISFLSIFGLLWMEFGNIESIDRRPSEIILFRKQLYSDIFGKLSINPKAPFIGFSFLFGAFCLIALIEYLNKSTFDGHADVYWFWIYIPVFMMIIHARQNFQPSMKKLLAMDKRKPTILLRSFSDESKYVKADPFGSSVFDYSLEDRLANYFVHTGPFVAVGSPSDNSPKLGAVRTQLADDKWQARVLNWIQSSDTIVLVLGVSYWLNWELDQVITNRYWNKLIILFPEEAQLFEGINSQDRAVERRDYLILAMKGTRWATALDGLRSIDPKDLRSIILHGDGDATVIVSKLRTRDAYHASAILAHYLLLRSQGQIEKSVSDYWSQIKSTMLPMPETKSIKRHAASHAPIPKGWMEMIGEGRKIVVDKDIMQIGRHEHSDIRLDHKTVHRRHAALQRSPQHDFIITDLSGAGGNGVLVNSKRVHTAALKDGDIIQLGEVRLKFQCGENADRRDPGAARK